MVHSDACPSCRGFLHGIRAQARSHRQLCAVLTARPDDLLEIDAPGDGVGATARIRAAELREQLTTNRQQLARIFYELGRGFVLMGISPNFSRVVAREPVPIPDMFQRGRNLLDEVERIAGDGAAAGSEWMRARELFGDSWSPAPDVNLHKGIELLAESLMLEPEHHDARIYLGHAWHVAGDRDRAIDEFRRVLEDSDDVGVRGFALLNLGNVHLEEGNLDEAEALFLELVESGAIRIRPQFGVIYFNLALAYGMQERFEECVRWLDRLDQELPHKRRMIAEEFRNRSDFVASLSRNPKIYRSLADRFPNWFPSKEAC